MTIDNALQQIFSTKKGYEKYGFNPNHWGVLKKRFKDGDSIPKESILKKCGAVETQNSEWKL
jgi:hypothetical protein